MFSSCFSADADGVTLPVRPTGTSGTTTSQHAGTRMEKDILSAIVEVEEEIQEQLVAEERTVAAKLCNLEQELAEESRREEGRLAEAVQQAVTAARAEAQERAAAIVHRAATL